MTDPFKEFRAPKTPLWSRMLGDWRAWRRARKARTMKYHIATIKLHGSSYQGRRVTGYVHLFETGKGKRSFKYERGELNRATDHMQFSAMHDVVIPWHHGKWDNKTIRDWADKANQRA